MKVWNFKVESDSQAIIKKLDSAFGSINGFVFDVENDDNSTNFRVRKRILSAFQTILRNHIIANGKITQTDTGNETYVEISFNQHILNILEVSIFLALGLLTIIFGIITGNVTASIFGGIFLVVGITYLIWVKKEFVRNVQEYKTLFSEILEL
ncbi:DUF423 domain-containing protein [Maribellus sp. CM-23]|uniref:hypothetical protein n=1 Tax=Maribellus sp. CM-23 TaxID=2781026 RepID=UPI001F294DA9|nr:hypothetical protein [Maribellus sp. CM-23]MCE4563174.1 DUF423 domain-containing protein [Maribellus sp. CM-23]